MSSKIKIVDGAIRMANTPSNIEAIEKYLRNLVSKAGLKTSTTGKPSLPKDLPKVYLDGVLKEFRNKARGGDLSVNKFKLVDASARAKSALKRTINELTPGKKITPRTKPEVAKASQILTQEMRDWASDLGYDDAQIEKYEFELAEELRAQGKKVNKANVGKGGTFFSTGHDVPLDKGGVNTPRNTKLQNLSKNTADSNKFVPDPSTQLAVGNPVSPTKSKFQNWQRDFLTWADRPENGGDGVLPQRRTYSPKIEQEFGDLNKAVDSKGKPLSSAGITELVDEKIAKLNPEIANAVTTAGKLTKFGKIAAGAGAAESAALIAGGNPVAGSIGLVMQTPAVQKQIAKLMAKQGVKLIPGVSLGSGLLQAGGYLMAGKYGKAALSTVGGVAGEFGPAGDAIQAMIDLGLTVDDIKQTKANKPDSDIDMTEGGKVKKHETGIVHSPTGQGDEAFDNVVNRLKDNPNALDTSGFRPRSTFRQLLKSGT